MGSISVKIVGDRSTELMQHLKSVLEADGTELRDNLVDPNIAGFSSEPVTFVATGVAVLSTLVNGLIAYVNVRKSTTIRIKGRDWEIAVPQDSSPERIKELVDLARDQDITRIEVQAHEGADERCSSK